MAVRLQFINLIVPVANLERAFSTQGGLAGFLSGHPGDMLWHDAYLCRVEGTMNWPDVDEMVARWEALGLQGLAGVAPRRWWKDFAICASGRGATFPCDWLEYDAAENCVYLAGTVKGDVLGPPPLS